MKNLTFISKNSSGSVSITLSLSKTNEEYSVRCVTLCGGVTRYVYDRTFYDYDSAWTFFISQVEVISL